MWVGGFVLANATNGECGVQRKALPGKKLRYYHGFVLRAVTASLQTARIQSTCSGGVISRLSRGKKSFRLCRVEELKKSKCPCCKRKVNYSFSLPPTLPSL